MYYVYTTTSSSSIKIYTQLIHLANCSGDRDPAVSSAEAFFSSADTSSAVTVSPMSAYAGGGG